ncbi:Non-heme 11 kDa protein of cytochrome bc1 complex [Mycena venus]|uniref:Non-heme 11 kDa protein of cytochrome bc1 complex n=1 Tax=Mycena venus TaxID=2733690 RepID=A0A8H6YXV2_9AGAR|nr:Non-heme 11 kDa protein of cytochrome bc1 complex [Mycena venus]
MSFWSSLFPTTHADSAEEEKPAAEEQNANANEDAGAAEEPKEEAQEEEEEPEDPHPAIRAECESSAACAPMKAHFEKCQEKVQAGQGYKGEDCVDEIAGCAGVRRFRVSSLRADHDFSLLSFLRPLVHSPHDALLRGVRCTQALRQAALNPAFALPNGRIRTKIVEKSLSVCLCLAGGIYSYPNRTSSSRLCPVTMASSERDPRALRTRFSLELRPTYISYVLLFSIPKRSLRASLPRSSTTLDIARCSHPVRYLDASHESRLKSVEAASPNTLCVAYILDSDWSSLVCVSRAEP